MAWIFFSLLAAFIWAVANIVDKHVLSKYKVQPVVFVFIISAIGFIIGLLFLLFNQIEFSMLLLIGLINGMIYPSANMLYFKAIKLEEVSRVVPWFAISPLLVVVGATIFLNEILTASQYLGVAILIIGLFLIAVKKGFRVKPNKWMLYILFSSLLNAFGFLLEKYLLNSLSLFHLFAVIEIGAFMGFLPYLFFYWPTIKKTFNQNRGAVKIIALNEAMGIMATFSMLVAIAIGLVSLVSVLGSMQYLFLLILALVVSIAYPKILKEELQGGVIALKAIAIVLIITGIYLIT